MGQEPEGQCQAQCQGVNHLEVMDKLGREEHRKDLRHGQQPRTAEPLLVLLLRSDEQLREPQLVGAN